MRFHVAAAALLGMITTTVADVSKLDSIYTPEKDSKVKVGTTEDIKWTIDAEEYTNAKVNIAVLGGKDDGHLQVIGNIATNVDNSDLSYSWEVKPTLDGVKLGKEKQYGIRIALADDETVYQYSPRFTIEAKDGGDDEDSTSSAVSSSSAAAASTTSKASKTSSAAEETSTESSKKTESADKPSTTMAVTTSSAAQSGAATSGAATSGATPSPSTSPTTTPDSAATQVGACAVGALGAVAVALFAM